MAIFYHVIEYLLGSLFTKDRRKGDEKMTDEAILIFDRISGSSIAILGIVLPDLPWIVSPVTKQRITVSIKSIQTRIYFKK